MMLAKRGAENDEILLFGDVVVSSHKFVQGLAHYYYYYYYYYYDRNATCFALDMLGGKDECYSIALSIYAFNNNK